jgi:predicted dinucleotide-binding enzyme
MVVKETKKIKIIGLGGIGSHLVEPLCRYLDYVDYLVELALFDGDSYEDKNQQRQRFSEKENKAKHTAKNMQNMFPRLYIKAKNVYITEDNVISSVRENDIVFMCVDNNATRKLVSERCEELNNVVLISGQNGDANWKPNHGTVIVYIRKDGQDVTRSLTDLHSKIKEPEDVNPGEIEKTERDGCEQQYEDTPQLLFTNLMVASAMCNCYGAYDRNMINFHQVYMDSFAQKMRPSPEPNLIMED